LYGGEAKLRKSKRGKECWKGKFVFNLGRLKPSRGWEWGHFSDKGETEGTMKEGQSNKGTEICQPALQNKRILRGATDRVAAIKANDN